MSVDGDRKATMTDPVVAAGRSKEDSRKQVSLSERETCSTSKNVGRVTWRDRGYCNWILKRRPRLPAISEMSSEGNSCVAVESFGLCPFPLWPYTRLTGSLIFFSYPSFSPFFSLFLHDHATLTTFFFSSPSQPVST